MRHVMYKIKRDGKGYDIVVKGGDAGGRRPKNKIIKSLIYGMYKHVINTQLGSYVFQKQYTALHEALRNGHIGLSKYLIHEGADVNMKAKVNFLIFM